MAVTLSSKSKRRNKKLDADQELITTSLKRFKITAEAEAESRRQGLEDLKFSIGTGQWDESVKANREIEGKPCLTVNRAPAFLRQYTGEERQHRPAMLVSPVGSGADLDGAKIHQGVLRHIEVASRADVVYDDSYDMMMRIGWCPWRVTDEFTSDLSFNREPRIRPLENPFAAYLSPIRQANGQDPLWAHIVEDLAKEEYEARYGKSEMAKLHFPTEMGNAEPEWVTKEGARIAEYWWIDLIPDTLCLMTDGSTQVKSKLAKELHKYIEQERDTVIRKVNCVKHNAIEVLERYDYLGKYIPIPEVNGVRLNVNGKIYRAGMVRDYRDAQRIYDFMVTRAVEQVDLSGKDPLFVAEGSIPGHEEEYRQMNRKNYPFLYYKAVNDQGQQLPPPTRANREPPIQAIMEITKQADYDMKAVIGIYGPSLGEPTSPQESGFAILNRQDQADTGAVTWHDNLNRAITWQGVILLDLWPKLIDSARVQRIVNPDDSVKHAVIFNSQYDGADSAQGLLNPQAGLKKAYDVGVGEYDLTLSAGPMSSTGRKEAFKALSVVIAEQPTMFPIVGDIWADNADFNGADRLAKRLKKMLPPNLQDDGNDDDPASQIAQLQSQLQALGGQHQQLVAELARATDTIRTNRLTIESKERIALMQAQVQILVQQLKDHGGANTAVLQNVIDAINHRLEVLHDSMSVEQEAGAAPATPELPSKVEPKVQPITPAAPVAPVPGTSGVS